jgi:hypothetical protein
MRFPHPLFRTNLSDRDLLVGDATEASSLDTVFTRSEAATASTRRLSEVLITYVAIEEV